MRRGAANRIFRRVQKKAVGFGIVLGGDTQYDLPDVIGAFHSHMRR